MYFKRKIYAEIKKNLDNKEIIVLTGMRRVGKTTVYRMLFDEIKSDNKVFLDIENPLDQKIFEEEDYNNIWANLKIFGVNSKQRAYIFMDEIQAKPEVAKAMKYLHDHYDVKFFATGSSSFYLKNLFPESLAGRKFVFEMFPLDFEEFLGFKNQPKNFYFAWAEKDKNKNKITFEKYAKLYDEYSEFGGFPQVVLEESVEMKKRRLNDIFKSYFEKDVQALADFREISAFRDLIILLSGRIGSKLDISKLAKEIGISRETVYSYIAFLQGTYFINLVPPFSRNADREVSGAKKIYFCDNGLAQELSRIDSGRIFENTVYHDIKKYGKIYYYQKRSGQEIDFVIPEKKLALEIKMNGEERDLEKTGKMARALGLDKSYVISRKFKAAQGIIPATEI